MCLKEKTPEGGLKELLKEKARKKFKGMNAVKKTFIFIRRQLMATCSKNKYNRLSIVKKRQQ